MCDANKSRSFFRPWNATRVTAADTTTISNCNNEKLNSPVLKHEEDVDCGASTSTHGSKSSTSSNVDAVNDTHVQRRISKDTFKIPSPAWSADSHEPSSATRSPDSRHCQNECLVLGLPTLHDDFFQQMALHHTSMNGSSTAVPWHIGLNPLHTSANGTTGQPFLYAPGLHLTQGLYQSTIEHAVDMIHKQDAVTKQMKKLRPKKFRCVYCDVGFSNNGQLKGHIRIHTGERPFKCDAENCGKSFTRNEELTRHKRIHTGQRPHACLVCGKCFGRKDHLKKHTRTHENRDPYRMSAAALGMLALGHALPQGHPFPPYVYPI